jgi:hypothetical protein
LSTNPYTPPGAPLGDRDGGPRGSTLWAVFLGVVADIGGTIVAGILITLMFPGLSAPEQGSADPSLPVAPSAGYLWFSLLVGLSFTTLGGYVAARVANNREYFHALLLGVASLVLGELMIAMTPEAYPLGQRLVGDLLVIPAALVGGHIRRKQKVMGQA